MSRPPSRFAIAALLVATGIPLGAAVPLGRLAVEAGVSPLAFALFPALVGGTLLALIAIARGESPGRLPRLALFGLVAGLLSNALPNTLAAWSAANAGASLTAVAYTLPPVFTFAYGLLLGFERFRWARMIALGCGLGGALWLAASQVVDGAIGVAGALVLFAIPAIVGIGNLYRAHRMPRGTAGEWLGAAVSLGAAAWLLPAWSALPEADRAIPLAGLPWLTLQVVAAAAAQVLFFALMRRVEPVTMSVVGYVMAIVAALIGAGLLGERLPWQFGPAALLIAFGVWLLLRTPAPPPPRGLTGESHA